MTMAFDLRSPLGMVWLGGDEVAQEYALDRAVASERRSGRHRFFRWGRAANTTLFEGTTDDMMNLRARQEHPAADLLREMTRLREARFAGRRKVGFAAERLMELEAGAATPPAMARSARCGPPAQWLPRQELGEAGGDGGAAHPTAEE